MSAALESLIWLVAVTLLMLLLKRWVHRHVQGVGLLLTGDPDFTFVLYSLLLLPGTFLHETAHYLMAVLLGVRVRKFSLMPARQPRGLLRLGFVEIERTDNWREALIGVAPLLLGSVAVLFVASFGLSAQTPQRTLTAQLSALLNNLPNALNADYFWLLLYLIFAISNGMLPSESDRQAWKPVVIWLGIVSVLVYLSGVVQRVPDQIDQGVALLVSWLVRAFVLACVVDIFCIPLIWLVEKLLETLTRRSVRY